MLQPSSVILEVLIQCADRSLLYQLTVPAVSADWKQMLYIFLYPELQRGVSYRISSTFSDCQL